MQIKQENSHLARELAQAKSDLAKVLLQVDRLQFYLMLTLLVERKEKQQQAVLPSKSRGWAD